MVEREARPWVVYALIAANVAMFAVELAHGASLISPAPRDMIELGASYPPLTLGGEWWRLGSSMFLHFGILHVALNLFCLYQARAVEPLFGHLGFLLIYVLAGLGGGVASLLATSGNVVIAGASGAVFGVYGAFGAKLVLHRRQIEPESWRRTVRSLGGFLLLNAIIGLSTAGISVSAHVGGFLVGAAAGAALLAGTRAVETRLQRTLGLAVVGVALTALAVTTIQPEVDPITPALTSFDTVERASVTRWNAGLERHRADAITAPALADELERDVLEPYRAMRRGLFATPDIPERLRPLFHELDRYTAARVAAWELFIAALREPAADKQQAMLADYKLREAEVTDRRTAFSAALQRLE